VIGDRFICCIAHVSLTNALLEPVVSVLRPRCPAVRRTAPAGPLCVTELFRKVLPVRLLKKSSSSVILVSPGSSIYVSCFFVVTQRWCCRAVPNLPRHARQGFRADCVSMASNMASADAGTITMRCRHSKALHRQQSCDYTVVGPQSQLVKSGKRAAVGHTVIWFLNFTACCLHSDCMLQARELVCTSSGKPLPASLLFTCKIRSTDEKAVRQMSCPAKSWARYMPRAGIGRGSYDLRKGS
jgi:hypothetical protein